MLRLTRFVLTHRLLVVFLWVALALAGAATAHTTTSRLSTSFTFPGQAGYQANTLIGRYYRTGGATPPVVVLLTAPPGGTVDRAQAGRAFAAANPTGLLRVLDYADTGDAAFVADGGRATYALMFPPASSGDRNTDDAILVELNNEQAKFPYGRLVRTPQVCEVVPLGETVEALNRHLTGDWGELDEESRAANDVSLREGFGLLSTYRTKAGVEFWVISEADRSVTTVLLPSDY